MATLLKTYMSQFTSELTIINKLLGSGMIVYDDDYRRILDMLRRSLKKIDKCVQELEKYDDSTIQANHNEVLTIAILLDLVGQSYDLIEKKLHVITRVYYEQRKRSIKNNV